MKTGDAAAAGRPFGGGLRFAVVFPYRRLTSYQLHET